MSLLKNDSLVSVLDSYLKKLLELSDPSISATDGDQPSGVAPIGFLDRLKAFEAAARWVAIKNKIDTGDDEDEFSRLRAGHVGRTGKRGSAAASRSNGGGTA